MRTMPGLGDIRKEVSPRLRIILGLGAWVFVLGIWVLLTHITRASGEPLISTLALPKPEGVLRALGRLGWENDLVGNVALSWWRIAQAFFWCVLVAIPLGLLMASFRWLHHLVNPIAAPMRSMPITAFLPAFIALFGIDEFEKIAFLWFGMFFYLLALVVEEVNKVDQSLLETAYTLGAKKKHALWLLFRASFPSIFGSFRILYDIGWTYVILAEMLNARKGVGYMVEAARKMFDFERVYAGIIAIGIAAFLFRFLLAALEKYLFGHLNQSKNTAGSGPLLKKAKAEAARGR
jgi:NitT/TauT family transport system permease protein